MPPTGNFPMSRDIHFSKSIFSNVTKSPHSQLASKFCNTNPPIFKSLKGHLHCKKETELMWYRRNFVPQVFQVQQHNLRQHYPNSIRKRTAYTKWMITHSGKKQIQGHKALKCRSEITVLSCTITFSTMYGNYKCNTFLPVICR